MWTKKLPEQRELLASPLNNDSSFKGFENPIDLFHIGTLRHGTSNNYNEYIIKNYSKLSKEKQESLLKFIDLHMIPLNSKACDIIISISESEESKYILQHLKTRIVLNHLVVPRVVFLGQQQYTGIGKILLTEGVAGAGGKFGWPYYCSDFDNNLKCNFCRWDAIK